MTQAHPLAQGNSPSESPVALIPLSSLRASRTNPRRVRLEREAHRRLVASIRSQGLLAPLVVRPDVSDDDGPTMYTVLAGNRRLVALRDAYRGRREDVSVACVVLPQEATDGDNARAVALAENFAREPMHPLDEAEAFARLASVDAKGVDAVAAEFGVSRHYVRQRLKLAGLSATVKAAYRTGTVDTATAEAFAAVPPDRQEQLWQELGGPPKHAGHVRNLIENAWVDGAHALFDPSSLPQQSVSRDLFDERVLVERGAFMAAQSSALEGERERLRSDGWGEVVVAHYGDARDRLWAMEVPPFESDAATSAKLAEIETERGRIEQRYQDLADEAEEGQEDAEPERDGADRGEAVESPEIVALSARLEELDELERTVREAGERVYSPEIKALSTAFLLLNTDGQVRREYRVPKRRAAHPGLPSGGHGNLSDGSAAPVADPSSPRSDDLTERQLASIFAHQAYAVREAALSSAIVQKRLIVLALHEKVRTEALSIRTEPNGSSLHASSTEGFKSPAFETLRAKRAELDPFQSDYSLSDDEAYSRLCRLDEGQLDALIELLTVELITAHPARRTPLVCRLADELHVDLRRSWRPDSTWLGGYRKPQLAHLLGVLKGPLASRWTDDRKKTELVEGLAKLFTDAAEGRLEDRDLADRVNRWLPPELRPEPPMEVAPARSAA